MTAEQTAAVTDDRIVPYCATQDVGFEQRPPELGGRGAALVNARAAQRGMCGPDGIGVAMGAAPRLQQFQPNIDQRKTLARLNMQKSAL